jgi:hypothetical protein
MKILSPQKGDNKQIYSSVQLRKTRPAVQLANCNITLPDTISKGDILQFVNVTSKVCGWNAGQ